MGYKAEGSFFQTLVQHGLACEFIECKFYEPKS
jgi:hypothetical protein